MAVRTGQADRYLYSDPGRLTLGLLPEQPWVDFAVANGIPHPSAYIYPPALAVLLAPLTWLPYHAANLAWFWLNVALLALSIRLLGRHGAPAAAAVMALAFHPTIRALQCGQVSLLMLFLLAAGLGALRSRSARGDAAAGACLALAAAVKLTPVVLIAWLAWSGRRRAAAWAAGLLALLAAIGVVVAGWSNHVLYVTGFLPELSRGAATWANQSINGFLNRLLTDASMSAFVFPPEPPGVRLLSRAAAVLLLAAAFVTARPRAESAADPYRRFALGYALVALTTLLVSPISWEHHFVIALIPLSVLACPALRDGRARAILPLALAWLLMAVDLFDPIRTGLPRGARPAMSYVLYGGLLLWWLTARAIGKRGEA